MKLFAGKINPPPSPPPLHLLGFCGFLGLLELCASCGHLCLYLGDAVCHSLYRPEKKHKQKKNREQTHRRETPHSAFAKHQVC